MFFTVNVIPKRGYRTREIAFWLDRKKVNFRHIKEEELLAVVPIEHMTQLGMLATLIVQHKFE